MTDRRLLGLVGATVLVAAVVAAFLTLIVDDDVAARGRAAPDFALPTVDGEQFELADHRGEVVVVEFLAPGCPSCTVDVAGLSETAREKPNVTLLLADVSGIDIETLADYYRGDLDAADELVIAADSQFTVAQAYEASALGHTVVITPEGTVSWTGLWAGNTAELYEQIERAAGT